jgi:hypothetical protein
LEVAGLVNNHLERPMRDSVWKRLAGSSCGAATGVRSWLRLHAALAAEDGVQIHSAADALLRDELPRESLPYVVAAHMTGLLLANEPQGALHSFQTHWRKLDAGQPAWQPVFRFLVGQTAGG